MTRRTREVEFIQCDGLVRGEHSIRACSSVIERHDPKWLEPALAGERWLKDDDRHFCPKCLNSMRHDGVYAGELG